MSDSTTLVEGEDATTVIVGDAGPVGPGVARGGATHDYLRKASGGDFDTEWAALVASSVAFTPNAFTQAVTVQAALDEMATEVFGGAPVQGQIAYKNQVNNFIAGQQIAGAAIVVTTDGRLSDQRVPLDGSVTLAKLSFDPATQVELNALAAAAVLDGDVAGGVLSGTYPSPGFAADMATQAELDAAIAGEVALRTAGDAANAAAIAALDAAIDQANIAYVNVGQTFTQPQIIFSASPGLTITSPAGASELRLDAPAGQVADLRYYRAGARRWIFRVDGALSDPADGSNTGSPWQLRPVSDANALLTPIIYALRTGEVSVGAVTPVIGGPSLTVQPTATSTVGLAVKLRSSPTGDAVQVLDSTGAVLTSIKADGRNLLPAGSATAPSLGWLVDDDGTGTGFYRSAANEIGWTINGVQRGAMQSGKLAVDAIGDLGGQLNLTQGGITRLSVTATGVQIVPSSTTETPLRSRGVASQTGDLQQWQDSTGAVLVAASAAGKLVFATDTNLYRLSAGVLVTDGDFGVAAGKILYADKVQSRASGTIQFSSPWVVVDAMNMTVGTTTGTKIGTATTQKLAFWNKTPIVQPAALGADAIDLPTALTLLNNIKNNVLTPVGLAA